MSDMASQLFGSFHYVVVGAGSARAGSTMIAELCTGMDLVCKIEHSKSTTASPGLTNDSTIKTMVGSMCVGVYL